MPQVKGFRVEFGLYLKAKRGAAGLTQRDVAAHLDYTSPQFVSNWERGLIIPPKETTHELRKLYKIDENLFFADMKMFAIAQVKIDFGKKLQKSDFPAVD